ncbi:MAG: HAMP domain-containing sensor histidine kinase [Verrucomicrobiota bacterium]|jgi:signal transduction histidine kinase
MAAFTTRRSQLQWLALLAVAVVLPTVSLLWFMSRVIANERLVVRQKLTALYQDKLTEASAKTESMFAARLASLDKINPTANPYSFFRHLVLESNSQGLVLWDAEGSVVYPRTADFMGGDASPVNPLAEAWHEEFAKKQYSEAAQIYDRFTADRDPHVAITAITGKSRCLSRLGRYNEAIEQCQKAAFAPSAENTDPALHLTIENARLLLLSLLKQSGPSPLNSKIFSQTVAALIRDLYNPAGDRAMLPANQNLFIAQKVLEALQGPFRFDDAKAKEHLEKLTTAEELSISAAETLRPYAGVFDGCFQTDLGQKPVYGLRHRLQSSTLLVLLSDAGMASVLSGYHDAFSGSESTYRILNASGDFVAGTPQPQGIPFSVAALPEGFPGWKAELYFQGGDVFQKAADRQIAVYAWTGFLVILLILIAGGFATRAVRRQIRLNEMKNDFIATVSHELKTPLSSMRVLVDTLLEGNVRDEAQANEYLRLTVKENERLSRMIENFLTFSRMERNKVAFTMVDAKPAVIASDAIESVKTKFAAHNCHLAVEIADDLPEIQADHDAIVTVLVNLLDNACKYTTDDKRVSLRIFPDDGFVCFAVSDNGIGLARRHIRRIFDRFYQVDSSLARKAEGCGLGLSIVKFIVDAHKGKITVESKPGQGSTFTVRLPVGRRNGD